MTAHGYFFCDHCDDNASGPRCEHCSHQTRWIHVALHHERRKPDGDAHSERWACPVSPERGRELFARLHKSLGDEDQMTFSAGV